MRKSAGIRCSPEMVDAAAAQTNIRAHIASTLQSTARSAKIFSQRLTILGTDGEWISLYVFQLCNAPITGLVRGLFHSGMRILVTGGAGFIGRHIREHFEDRAEVRVLDNLRSGFESNLPGLHCQLLAGSILDRDLVREAMKGVDSIFYLAAMVERAGDVKCSVANMDKTQTAGFRPVCDLAGGLHRTIEFVRKDLASIKQGRHL
jgi:NAD dependent epimerase/dehydratase family